jgi:hypothetical protein
MNDLVQRLSERRHPVEVSLRPERTLNLFKECLDRGYVHVKFTETRGGTELGFEVDRERSNLSNADLEQGTGQLVLCGELSLDFVRVRCVANIELPDMRGQGWLEPLPEAVATS